MTTNVSAFGLRVVLQASVTFPFGTTFTNFGDDTDPLDIPSLQIGDTGMNINGNLVTWSKANPIKVTLSLVTASEDDQTMSIIFQANRVGRGKKSVNDVMNMSIFYPDGRLALLNNGCLLYTSPSPRDGLLSRMPSSA